MNKRCFVSFFVPKVGSCLFCSGLSLLKKDVPIFRLWCTRWLGFVRGF